MEKLTLIYSVQNGGDGSAYPRLMESMELAEWDQDNMWEGWGESCTGTFEVESESPIKITSSISTPESVFIEMIYYSDQQMSSDDKIKQEQFLEQFFPNGFPLISVSNCKEDSKYYDLHNKETDKFIQRRFAYPKRTEKNSEDYGSCCKNRCSYNRN